MCNITYSIISSPVPEVLAQAVEFPSDDVLLLKVLQMVFYLRSVHNLETEYVNPIPRHMSPGHFPSVPPYCSQLPPPGHFPSLTWLTAVLPPRILAISASTGMNHLTLFSSQFLDSFASKELVHPTVATQASRSHYAPPPQVSFPSTFLTTTSPSQLAPTVTSTRSFSNHTGPP